jgi:integrase
MLPIPEFLDQLKSEGAARKTQMWYGNHLNKFAAHCPKPLQEITTRDVYDFRQTIADPHTQYNALRAIKKFLKANGLDLKIVMPTYTEPEPQEYSCAQLTALFAAADERETRLFKFYLLSGCREGEVQHSTYDCLTSDHFVVREHSEWGWAPKKKKTRFVPVPASLSTLIGSGKGLIFPNRDGRPNGHHHRTLQFLAKRAGLNPAEFWLHKFRSSAATRWLRAGFNVQEVAAFLGHSDLKTVLRYLALASTGSDRVKGLVNSAF